MGERLRVQHLNDDRVLFHRLRLQQRMQVRQVRRGAIGDVARNGRLDDAGEMPVNIGEIAAIAAPVACCDVLGAIGDDATLSEWHGERWADMEGVYLRD